MQNKFLIESRTNVFLLDRGGGTYYNKIGDNMKDKRIIFGITLAFIFLASVGFSYAYFSNSIVQNDVKDHVVETGTLQLTYTDGPEINIQIIMIVTKVQLFVRNGLIIQSYLWTGI